MTKSSDQPGGDPAARRDMPGELPEEAVGQSEQPKPSGIESGNDEQPGQQGDPNREPGGDTLYNEDKQGGVFYDKNTEIRREGEFHDATAAPIADEKEKVTPDNDEFGKQSER